MIALLRYSRTKRVFEQGHKDLRAWVSRLRYSPENLKIPFCLMTTAQLMKVYDPDGTKPVTNMKFVGELSRQGFEKVYLNGQVKTGFSGPQTLWAIGRNRKKLLAIVQPSKLREIYDGERQAFINKYKNAG